MSNISYKDALTKHNFKIRNTMVGSWTMNQVSLDSLDISIKATNYVVDGKQIPIYK